MAKRITLFAGHYGSGKTNIAVNYALHLKESGIDVKIADLDIVNPYFRTRDSEAELTEAGMISSQSIRNRTHLAITKEGRETLHYFENRVSDAIKADIKTYFRENEFTLRNEVSVLGDYYKSTSGEYEAHLVAKDRGINLIDLTLSVPVEEVAAAICDNWQKKNQDIYKYLIQELF